ncbi:hypothetical protein Tco_1246307 [Tanacetum coccineum]
MVVLYIACVIDLRCDTPRTLISLRPNLGVLHEDLSRRYSTSVTKTKAATYELKWIEDLVPELWSLVQLKYDQHAYLGTSHWGPKRQSFYGYASNLTSSKYVYSRRRIITVTRLKIMKKYDYGHLEEIEVRQDDQKLYTFKEDQNRRKRLMLADELHKFSDGTLNDVRSALYDIDAGIRMEYLLKRKWSNLDKKRARVMVQDIDRQLYQRRLMQNLEKFVGGRNQRDLPRDIPLDSVVVLRYEKRSKSENKGKVPTEMELVLEQTQQGAYYEVSYEHVGLEVTRSQEGKRSQDDEMRLCLVDDLKKFKITFLSSQRYKPKPKVKDHYIYSQIASIPHWEKPNKVYDPFLKAGLGYQNLKRLKKAIKAQPKLYNGDNLHNTKLKINSPDSEETLENAKKVD